MERKMIIRAKTFRTWLAANFSKQQLSDLARYGADGGWPGLSYFTDTSALYEKFKSELYETLYDLAEEYGCPGPVAYLAEYARHGRDAATVEQFECAVVWVVAEHYAYAMTESE